MLLDRLRTDTKEIRTAQISDICKRRLLGYAETFQELAGSFGGEFQMLEGDRQTYLEKHRLWENRQVICSNLKEMAQIMTEVAEEVFRYELMEDKKRRLLTGALKEEGIYIDNLCYLPQTPGRKAIALTMHTEKKIGRPASEVADMLSVLLDTPLQLSVTSPYFVDRQEHSYIFVEEPRLIALTGFSRATRENENISGDNYAIIESEKGRITIILSDGTGSGEQASRDSGKVLDLMEKMLEAGYGIEAAINLVNGALFAKGEEQNHPTLDICDIDLYKGKCVFCKVGGVASFLKRENKVEQISVGNLPLGIFQSVQTQSVRRDLQNGDYLIMMSDGVLDALGENSYEEAMYDAIREITEQNPKEIAEKLLQMVLRISGGRILDDMTILVTGVWDNNRLVQPRQM